MLSPKEIYQLIQKRNLFQLQSEVIEELLNMDPATYDQVVVHLLTDDGEYSRSSEKYDGHYDYHCQIQGCRLFMLRPSSDIYHHVLDNSYRIADPSSCEVAVVALLQTKAAHDVAVDLLGLINRYSDDTNADQKQSCIFSMFYWLGISPSALSQNIAWPGRNGGSIYAKWFNSRKGIYRGDTDPVTGHPTTPPADPIRATEVALLIVEKMLDVIEANSANQTARNIISQLPLPDKDYLKPYRDRIIRAYISAQSSSDEYVRHRASQTYRDFKDLN